VLFFSVTIYLDSCLSVTQLLPLGIWFVQSAPMQNGFPLHKQQAHSLALLQADSALHFPYFFQTQPQAVALRKEGEVSGLAKMSGPE
jgi:hypothetical protein